MAKANENGADLKRLGFLLRLYRTDSGDGLDELVERMAAQNADRAELDGATVARWENGESAPPREFLEDFADMFRLSQSERNAMLELGGCAPSGPLDLAASLGRDALRRGAAPKVYALGAGYSLNAMGQDGTVVLVGYSAVSLAIVGGQGILRWRSADTVSELFFMTMFFVLNVSLLMFAVTRMDHFGFYAFLPWDGYFLLLTLVVHLALALAASAIFDALRGMMYPRNASRKTPDQALVRALWTALPPCLFVFFNMMVFVNQGGWIFYLITLGVTVAGFTTILAFRDERVTLSEYEAKLSLAAAVAAIITLCAAGAAGTMVAYLSPSPLAVPDHNLLTSWEIDYERLGYPPEEMMERYRVGILLMSIPVIAYLAIALGGFLLSAARLQMSRALAAGTAAGAPSGGGGAS